MDLHSQSQGPSNFCNVDDVFTTGRFIKTNTNGKDDTEGARTMQSINYIGHREHRGSSGNMGTHNDDPTFFSASTRSRGDEFTDLTIMRRNTYIFS